MLSALDLAVGKADVTSDHMSLGSRVTMTARSLTTSDDPRVGP